MAEEAKENENEELLKLAQRARKASQVLGAATTEQKDDALGLMLRALKESQQEILAANEKDVNDAKTNNVEYALQKRLSLKGEKYASLLKGLEEIKDNVRDPVGKLSLARKLDEGLELYRVACPIGVVCIIFESRPDAAVQIASLALKSANALILKGGKEAKHSNQVLVKVIRQAIAKAGLPEDCIQLVSTREQIKQLLTLDEYVDLIIPRGSNQLVKYIMHNTSIPVLGHADGICSVYVDKDADIGKAVDVVVDSKTQYPAVCNAAETVLIHEQVLSSHLPEIAKALIAKGVAINADPACIKYIPEYDQLKPLSPDAYRAEYLKLEINFGAVANMESAIEHINTHGSHHTDCIVTDDKAAADSFMRKVDSAGVFHNCSTRFADGFRYGFGAEIGVSTNRIHARGPVGLEGLVIYKYRLHGNGQCVASYGAGKKQYLHEDIPFGPNDQAPPL